MDSKHSGFACIYAAIIEQAFGGLKFKSTFLQNEIDQSFSPVNCSLLDLQSLQGGFSTPSMRMIMIIMIIIIIIMIIIIMMMMMMMMMMIIPVIISNYYCYYYCSESLPVRKS